MLRAAPLGGFFLAATILDDARDLGPRGQDQIGVAIGAHQKPATAKGDLVQEPITRIEHSDNTVVQEFRVYGSLSVRRANSHSRIRCGCAETSETDLASITAFDRKDRSLSHECGPGPKPWVVTPIALAKRRILPVDCR